MDTDLQKLVDDFIKEINTYEGELASFKNNVDGILSETKNKANRLVAALDKKFDEESMSEEDYLRLLKEKKKEILDETKTNLDLLLKGLE